jgi:lipopolysaccharide transport system permease protein
LIRVAAIREHEWVYPMMSADVKDAIPQIIEIRSKRGVFNLDLHSVWRYRELLYFLIWRETKVRYKQAVLGAGWAILQPVFAVLIFTIVFGKFAKMPSDGIPYAVFSFTALLPWTYFAEAVRRSGTGLVENAELIKKIYFPRLLLPLAMVTAPVVDFFWSFLCLLALLAWYGITPTINVIYLPLFLIFAMLQALALGLWLGPMNVRFRDIKHIIPFMIQIWMYASPIVFPMSVVPEKWRLIYSLNPMVGVIEGFRWALLGKGNPDFQVIGVSMSLIALMLLVGIVYFKKMERSFADLI